MFYIICFLFLTRSYLDDVAALDTRIINGDDAPISEYPYQLLMHADQAICGASIISPDWALTAAHCLSSKSNITFRAGSSSFTTGGTEHYGTEVYVNENFSIKPIDYDIALVKVSPPFLFGSTVKAVPLASNEAEAGTEVVVTGWGLTNLFSNSVASTLQAAKLRMRSRFYCNRFLNSIGFNFTERMICAGNGFTGTCSGDSGGPIVNTQTGEQIGIVSFGIPLRGIRCFLGHPEYYTNVANQRDWIKRISGV